ncbi:MAG: alpha/beta hydrolase [Hyphomicrobiaceae bacterium]
MTERAGAFEDIYFTCRDGLRLHGRHYPAPASGRRPVVCLPGLTRNARDFAVIAERLADPRRHRRAVYALDYRGRGLSEHDPDWRNYAPLIECLDVLDFMTMMGLHDAAILGTSRGGIIAMMMAVLRPGAIGAAILNDIGPVIERNGLTRIVGYVGRMPLPATWEEAAAQARDTNRKQFPAVSEAEWLEIARAWFNDENGLPSPAYDPALAKSFTIAQIDGELPAMWDQFRALIRVPVLAIRGENSDLLSPETLARMGEIHPRLEAMTVPKQGHAPLLRDEPTIGRIVDFLTRTDGVTASP